MIGEADRAAFFAESPTGFAEPARIAGQAGLAIFRAPFLKAAGYEGSEPACVVWASDWPGIAIGARVDRLATGQSWRVGSVEPAPYGLVAVLRFKALPNVV